MNCSALHGSCVSVNVCVCVCFILSAKCCHECPFRAFFKGNFRDLFLMNVSFLLQYPVYFAFEDSDTEAVLADIKRNDATGQPATATTGG